MRILITVFIALLLIDIGFWGYYFYARTLPARTPIGAVQDLFNEEKPLERFSFENLKNRDEMPSMIEVGDELRNDEEKEIVSYMFYYQTEGEKKVSGVMHTPHQAENAPVIVMFRGYVNPATYYPGLGTENYAAYLAERGFVTLAPDFLDHGESDLSGELPLEGRFETYTTALDLLSSVSNLNTVLEEMNEYDISVDPSQIGIWGHSNGGHIALSVLAITGKEYPTVLWNPVSKHFPYSIMYYMDETEDQGKYLRQIVADFEAEYSIDQYSTPNYYDWITAPIQLHQGAADTILPQKWSDQLDATLTELEVDVEYTVHPGSDHNLVGGTGWSNAAAQGVSFYEGKFQE